MVDLNVCKDMKLLTSMDITGNLGSNHTLEHMCDTQSRLDYLQYILKIYIYSDLRVLDKVHCLSYTVLMYYKVTVEHL